MNTHPIFRVFLFHVGFHSFWVLLYIGSLLGMLILTSAVGMYNAFVLGFLGKSVISSATAAAVLGYVVFTITGFVSGWLISRFHPKSVALPACLTVVVAVGLLFVASLVHHRVTPLSSLASVITLPSTTGRPDADRMSMALKTEYDLQEPALPPYLEGKGVLVPLSEFQARLRLLSKDFVLADGPYLYCNLASNVWMGLKNSGSSSKYPILWSARPNLAGKRLVFFVNLKSDVFSDEFVAEETFQRTLIDAENTIQHETGNPSIRLRQ